MIALCTAVRREATDSNNFVAVSHECGISKAAPDCLEISRICFYCEELSTKILTSASRLLFLSLQFSLLDVRSFLLNRISIESSYFHSHSLFSVSFYSKPSLLFRLLFIAFYISPSCCVLR